MAERTNHIDFAQAVLRKYPDAKAVEVEAGQWRIAWGLGLNADWSEQHFDRDLAWQDAYRRIYKTTPTSESK